MNKTEKTSILDQLALELAKPQAELQRLIDYKAQLEADLKTPVAAVQVNATVHLEAVDKLIAEFQSWKIEDRQESLGDQFCKAHATELCELLRAKAQQVTAKKEPALAGIGAKISDLTKRILSLPKESRHTAYADREANENRIDEVEALELEAAQLVRSFEVSPNFKAFRHAWDNLERINIEFAAIVD